MPAETIADPAADDEGAPAGIANRRGDGPSQIQ